MTRNQKLVTYALAIIVTAFTVIASNPASTAAPTTASTASTTLTASSCGVPFDPQSACEDDCLDTYWDCWNACGIGAESYITCKPGCTNAYDLCVFSCYLFPCGPDPV